MSIKTSKRIALGVIASLVFAPFVAIAPASAAVTTGTAAGDTTLTVVTPTSRPNVAGVYTVGFKAAKDADENAGVAVVVRAALTRPAGSNATISLAHSLASADGFDQLAITGGGTAAITYTGDAANAAVVAAADTLQVTATLNPDVVGTYTLMYFADINNNSAIDTGEGYISQTVSVVADAPVLSVTVFGSTTSAATVADKKGALVRLTLTNGGVATSLSGTELFQLSGVDTFATGGTTAKTTVTRADFNDSGVAWIQAQHTTAGVRTLVVQGVGGGIASMRQTATITYLAPTALDGGGTQITSFAKTNTTGVATNADNDLIPAARTTTLTFRATGATTAASTTFEAGDVVEASVVDTLGAITGKATLGYVVALTLGTDATASFSVTVDMVNNVVAAPTAGTPRSLATVTLEDTTDNVKTIQSALVLPRTFAITPTSVRAVNGSTVNVSGNLKDQFGANISNVPVTATLGAGSRNSGVFVTRNLVTDSSGNFSFSYTDAPLTANAALTTDTFAIAAGGSTSQTADGGAYAAGQVVATFAASVGVSTITLGGGNNSALGVALATPVINDIKAGAGAETGVQTITATVRDANGSVLVGVPVTWTVSDAGTKANILSTRATSFTNASGEATTSVYAWINGTYTVTAAADGKTATVTIDFRQTSGGGEERTISAAASGRVVTATVIDRFGNPVPGVTVWAIAPAGNSFLGYVGAKRANVTTDLAGKAEFVVGGADATITVTTIDPTVVGAVGSGQTCAAAARISCAATATALAAATAGTATTAETGVGNSLAPAGVATATAAVTGINPVAPEPVYEKPTLSIVQSGGRVFLSGTAENGEGDIIIYVKRVGTTAWKERAKTLEVAAPGDFNGSIKAPRGNVVIRVKQEGTGLFSNQVIIVK
jgi:hypothetical protein